MMKIFNFLLFLTLSGCTYFIGKLDTPLVNDKNYLKNIPQGQTYCPEVSKANFQLIGADSNSQNTYLSMIDRIGGKTDIIDHLVLWSLLQLAIRPDQSSPTARFQILISLEGKSQYLDFFSEVSDDQYPLLYGLEWILKKYKRPQRLEHYANLIERNLGQKLKIGKDFENFLLSQQEFIKDNPELAPFFFRGTEVLKENESPPHLNYSAVISAFRKVEKKQQIIINSSLTSFVTKTGYEGSCNYDFNLYDSSIFLIDKDIPVANIFGLSISGKTFMASTSQKLLKAMPIAGQPLFKGESKVRSSAVCVMEKDYQQIWTFSNLSRDPGQHLFHLIRYGLPQSQTFGEVDRLIRHSRHLFLSDPVRLIIESGRSRREQIENLLKLNLPIYNAQKLGNIWAWGKFHDQGRFIIDERNPGAFLCR